MRSKIICGPVVSLESISVQSNHNWTAITLFCNGMSVKDQLNSSATTITIGVSSVGVPSYLKTWQASS